jgi:hypothetical protein
VPFPEGRAAPELAHEVVHVRLKELQAERPCQQDRLLPHRSAWFSFLRERWSVNWRLPCEIQGPALRAEGLRLSADCRLLTAP